MANNKAKQVTTWCEENLMEMERLRRFSTISNEKESNAIRTTSFSMDPSNEQIHRINKKTSSAPIRTKNRVKEAKLDALSIETENNLKKIHFMLKTTGVAWLICFSSLIVVSTIGLTTPQQKTGYKCLSCQSGYSFNATTFTCFYLCNNATQYWNSTNCIDSFTYNNQTCFNTTQCLSPMICNLNATGQSCNCPANSTYTKCDCQTRVYGNEYYSNGITCTPALEYGNACNNTYECQYLTQNTYCSIKCQCKYLQYFQTSLKFCINQLLIYQQCILSSDCRGDLGLSCQSGLCLCNSAIQFWNGLTCTNKYLYNNQSCTYSYQCANSYSCNYNGTSCNCPLNVVGKCDCPTRAIGSEYYYNGTLCISALTYNQTCIANYTCKYLTQNTFCNGTCICPPTTYFNTTFQNCTNQLTYNQSCSYNQQCRDDLGLICITSQCKCNSTIQFWTGTSCVNYYTYDNQTCTSTSQCASTLTCNLNSTNSTCNCPSSLTSNKCDCPRTIGNEYYWNGSLCVLAATYGNNCFNLNYTCQILTQNTYCNGLCQCVPLQYFNTNQSYCVNQLLVNETCILNTDCRIDLGLSCISSQCKCNSTSQFWTGTSCVNYYTYDNQICTSTSECASNLRCLTSGSSCNCPTAVAIGKCDCQARVIGSEYYWNGTYCVPAASYGQPCQSGDYTCQTLTQLTQCDLVTSKCTCGSNGKWNSINCIFCPVGWLLYRGSCFIGSSAAITLSIFPTSSIIKSSCFNQAAARMAILQNTDAIVGFFNTINGFNAAQYYFDAIRAPGDTIFYSSNGLYSISYSSLYWSSLGTSTTLCATLGTITNLFINTPCTNSFEFLCEIIL